MDGRDNGKTTLFAMFVLNEYFVSVLEGKMYKPSIRTMILNPISIFVFTTFLLLSIAHVTPIKHLNGKCGFPGKPYMGKVLDNNGHRTVYGEGETVRFDCIHFWSPLQTRQCRRGRWLGPHARCGKLL